MRRSLLAVLAVLGIGFLFTTATASAQTSNHIRLLFHGTTHADSTGFGMGGWVIAPNITSSPDKWFAVTGPRYNGSGGRWLEVMGGAIVQKGESTPLIDVRANLGRVGPLTACWTNVQWIDPAEGSGSAAYLYFEVDVPVPIVGGVFGLETENLFKFSGKDDVSAGIHLKTLLGSMIIVTAFQLHFFEEKKKSQLWTRAIINF